jgi:hypothetical protein
MARTPIPRTPAGAYLQVKRNPRWTRIVIDRFPITDATAAQSDTAHRLTTAAAVWSVTHGKRGAVSSGGGRIVWSTTVPTVDADTALAALLALEAGDHGLAEALAARYEQDTPKPTHLRKART